MKTVLEMHILAARLMAAGIEDKIIKGILENMRTQLDLTKEIQREKIKGLEAEKDAVPYTTGSGGGSAYGAIEFNTGQDVIGDIGGAQKRMDQIVQDRKDKLQAKIEAEKAKEGGGDKAVIADLATQIINTEATWGEKMASMKEATKTLSSELAKLGPEGEFASALFQGLLDIGTAFETLANTGASTADRLAAAGAVISTIGNISAKASAAKIAGIDREIEAEKKRDGKSKESLAKLKALEAKKEAMKRKAFEQDKKVKMAETIINTAAGIAKSFPEWPMMILIAAMGAAQLAIIAGTSYQGGAAAEGPSVPAKIEVGKRTSKVDVSQQASAGELAYLRGQRGIGTTATNFVPQGGAAGLRKGYADGGNVLVGERGPETITPLTGLNVVPAGQGAKGTVNANFTIHAIDAAGVEDVLMAQQGNIINMIREAANDYGEEFLEVVNTDTYGESGSGTYGGD